MSKEHRYILALPGGRERRLAPNSAIAQRDAGVITFVGTRNGIPCFVPATTDAFESQVSMDNSIITPRRDELDNPIRLGPTGLTRTNYTRGRVSLVR